ncbi:hypothetical protein M432DRAFT_590441 [Thermoascus aurantiacus ATCC 26904]
MYNPLDSWCFGGSGACLYENSCSSDVRTFYSSYDTTCASVSASGSTTAAASTTPVASSAAATTTASATAAATSAGATSRLTSDLSSCFCLADFSTAVKKCLYETSGCGRDYVSSFYNTYDGACASVTNSSTNAGSASSTAVSTGTPSASVPTATSSNSTTPLFTGGANVLKGASPYMGVAALAIWGGMATLF